MEFSTNVVETMDYIHNHLELKYVVLTVGFVLMIRVCSRIHCSFI